MYQKILVPIDGSVHSQYTLTQAIVLAQTLGPGTTLTLVHVGSYAALADMAMAVDLNTLLADEGKAILQSAEAQFAGLNVQHDSRYLAGDPAESICRLAEEGQYDLVVIGNRGGGLFAELLMGSVSHKVIHHAPCPVLVVRRAA
jgi:nucleotide-binding universal stress UspA family protein